MSIIKNPLDFEKPLVELEEQLDALGNLIAQGDETKHKEFATLEKKIVKLQKDIYGKLTPYQKVQLSRHTDRPFTADYIDLIITDFVELHGDRAFRDDPAIICGIGRIAGISVIVVGQQRGRTTNERIKRNFAMPQPEGYRKALRMFKLAEKFQMPVITFIDTPGAFPGIEAEERGQAEAIARNLMELAELRTPVIAVVIGEGGSGGALALGVADRVFMMSNASYSVISPEGCASILWASSKNEDEPSTKLAAQAAEMLKITAKDLQDMGVIDDIIPEPLGGAHRNHKEAAELLQTILVKHLEKLKKMPLETMLDERYKKFRKMGSVAEA